MTGARDTMLAGAPVTEQECELAGAKTAVLEGGEGPPLVLLHGAIECGAAIWAPVLSHLAARHRVIVPDFPGLGESQPLTRIDPDSFSVWLRELFEARTITSPTVVAHSMIGGLAARFASQYGSLLSRLVVYAAPGIGRYRMPLELRYRALRFAVAPTLANFERFQRYALWDRDFTRARDPDWFDAFSAYTVARARDPDVKATMRRLVSTRAWGVPHDQLARIDVPTALLWGHEDRMAPIRIARLAARRHGWPLVVIDRAGHVPHIEQGDAFVTALEEICRGSHG